MWFSGLDWRPYAGHGNEPAPGEQAISADTRADVGAVAPQPAVVPLRTPFELSRLTTRILFGTLMGGAGAGIILAGGWVFTAVICLVVYQASQEFYGFVTSKVLTCTRLLSKLPAPRIVCCTLATLCYSCDVYDLKSSAPLWRFDRELEVTASPEGVAQRSGS